MEEDARGTLEGGERRACGAGRVGRFAESDAGGRQEREVGMDGVAVEADDVTSLVRNLAVNFFFFY